MGQHNESPRANVGFQHGRRDLDVSSLAHDDSTVGAARQDTGQNWADLAAKAIVKPEPEAARLTIFTAADALAPLPEIVWALESYFVSPSVNVLYGPPGTGKTYALLDFAVCFALGVPWLSLQTAGGPVLIVDEESGFRRLSGRIAECLRGHRAGPETPLHYITLAGLNLSSQPDRDALAAAIAQTGARLVIVDALLDVAGGADENSATELIPLLHGLRQIADAAGAAVVVIHHANKLGDLRGSTAIRGAADAVVQFGPAAGTQTLTQMATEKQRDGIPQTVRLEMRFGGGEFFCVRAADAPHDAGVILTKVEKFVLQTLEAGPRERDAIMHDKAAPGAAGTIRNAIYRLVGNGLIRRADAGGKGSVATFELVAPEAGKS
jgi:hypothetical protein